jgi:hypothetical protein
MAVSCTRAISKWRCDMGNPNDPFRIIVDKLVEHDDG